MENVSEKKGSRGKIRLGNAGFLGPPAKGSGRREACSVWFAVVPLTLIRERDPFITWQPTPPLRITWVGKTAVVRSEWSQLPEWRAARLETKSNPPIGSGRFTKPTHRAGKLSRACSRVTGRGAVYGTATRAGSPPHPATRQALTGRPIGFSSSVGPV